jgi:hypothetical protein
VLNRKDPINAMMKLVDACNQSSRLFFVVSPATTNPAFQQLALAAWQKLSQFEFELKIELRRLGGMDSGRTEFAAIPRDPSILAQECRTSLEILLRQYEETLQTTLSAHARAMITRQFQEIQKHHEKLAVPKTAA